MTPSDICKASGLKSLSELSEITGRSRRTLQHWAKEQPAFFAVVVSGAVKFKGEKEMQKYHAQLHPKTFEQACDDDITLGEALGPDGCDDFNLAADFLIQYKEAIEEGDEDMAEYMCLRLGRLLLPAGMKYINGIVGADE